MSEARKNQLFMRQQSYDRRYRKQLRIGPITLGFISIFFLTALAIFYLTQTNRIATKGYDRAALMEEKEALTEEKEYLEVEAARLQSVSEIEKDLEDKKLVKNKSANFLKIPGKVASN